MTAPVRLRLFLQRGFDLQAHSRAVNGLAAVNVARPTKWGNPFVVVNEAQEVVERYRRCLEQPPSLIRHKLLTIARGMEGRGEGYFSRIREAIDDLRGKNLACWCALDAPCHADVLLEIANRPTCEAVDG